MSSAAALSKSGRMMMTMSEQVDATESFSDVQARMELFADVETGSPSPPRKEDNAWRSRRLHTYDAEGHYDGDGATHASHLFHRDYRHYKFYGYGGKGAKTSWAHNPKHTYLGSQDDPRKQLYAGHLGSTLFQESGAHHEHDNKPFRKHSSARISVIRGSSSSPASARYARKGGPGCIGASMDLSASTPKLSLEESKMVDVDLARMAVANTRRASSSNGPVVKVVTYPTMLEGDNFEQSARSTKSGQPKFCRTQAPFHQRYNHYKYYGFAGHGARTSWASGGGPGPHQP